MSRSPRPPAVAFSSLATAAPPAVRKVKAKEPSRPATTETPEVPETDTHVPASLLLPKAKPLSSVEARRLVAKIVERSPLQALYVARAHEGKAHAALGHRTWAEFCKQEMKMSESRSFQLIDTARLMRELAEVGASIEEIEPPPARIVQAIKHHLPEVRDRVRDALASGEDISTAIRSYADSVLISERSPAPAPRKSEARTVRCPSCEGSGLVTARESNDIKRRLGL